MTAKVVTLNIGAGIQRDGTVFASRTFVDGKWVRFQYGRPRKMGGYKGIFLNATGISRGMIMSADNGLNYVISGYSDGLERWTTDNDDGVGFGPVTIYLQGPLISVEIVDQGASYTNGTYTNVPLVATYGTNGEATVVVAGNEITSVTVTSAGNDYGFGETITINPVDVGGTGSGF